MSNGFQFIFLMAGIPSPPAYNLNGKMVKETKILRRPMYRFRDSEFLVPILDAKNKEHMLAPKSLMLILIAQNFNYVWIKEEP